MTVEDHSAGEDNNDGLPTYRSPEEVAMWELAEALSSLTLLGDDLYLRMQANNVAMVDKFIMDVEADALRQLIEAERTPMNAMFLSAQTQMWIFAVYEIFRTWRENAKDAVKLHAHGGLPLKIQSLRKHSDFRHFGREIRAKQLERVLKDASIISRIEEDLRLTHILFFSLEHLRISFAKHQVRGKPKSIAYAPGYGRIDDQCGSLNYELSDNAVIWGTISRRQIADLIRGLSNRANIPTPEAIKAFDENMKRLSTNLGQPPFGKTL